MGLLKLSRVYWGLFGTQKELSILTDDHRGSFLRGLALTQKTNNLLFKAQHCLPKLIKTHWSSYAQLGLLGSLHSGLSLYGSLSVFGLAGLNWSFKDHLLLWEICSYIDFRNFLVLTVTKFIIIKIYLNVKCL